MKIAEIEYTPNPNAVKFVLKDALTPFGTVRSFSKSEEAEGNPLAERLFAINHVISVFFADRFITVTQDGEASWHQVLRELAVPIREAEFEDANPGLEAGAQGSGTAGEDDSPKLGMDDPRIPHIMDILEEHILPFLASDGGGLEIQGLVNNELFIRYQGACGTCPASLTGTLMAIENLVQQEVDPELIVTTL
jgi:Fe-S cluster biogenesis protein NfuA